MIESEEIKIKYCSICNSTKRVSKYEDKFYCGKHYLQLKRHGKILERTRYMPNDFIIEDNIVKIIIYNNNFKQIAISITNKEYLDLIIKYKWCLTADGYVMSYKDKSYLYLHRLLTNAVKGEYVDHINHDILDNRINNLRKCTNSQNLQNHTKLASNNTSGVTGVYWIKSKNKWRSEIAVNKQKFHLGYYINLQDAIKAREEAEDKYFGEFKSNKNYNIKGDIK